MTEEEMMKMLKLVRTLAWIGWADSRREEEYKTALYEILVATKRVGND